MCGIAGWYAYGKYRPRVETLKGLLLANLERGSSAAGMAWLTESGIHVRKGKGPASAFIEHTPNEVFQEAAASPRGLVHARATTKGSENVNANNHPVVGCGWVAVHNGSFSNDDDLWGYYKTTDKVERFAEVDTSVINLMLSRGKSVEDSIFKMSATGGSATIAAWSEADPEVMLLGRWGHNDLHMFFDPVKQILYWSSAASAAYVMPGVVMGRHKFLTMSRLADDHVLLLNPTGIDATRVFKVTRRPFIVARKVVKSSPPAIVKDSGGTPKSNASSPATNGEILAPHPLGNTGSPSAPSSATSRISGASLSGVKKERGYLRLGADWVEVEFQAPQGALGLKACWKDTNGVELAKPKPMHDIFKRSWWAFSNILFSMQKDGIECMNQPTGYGTWFFFREKSNDVRCEFRAHKRVKAWMERVYKQRFQLPAKMDGDGRTALDDHMHWEHYDISLIKSDKSSVRALGWMCPWCGIWASSTKVMDMRGRCEFCFVKSRTGEVE